MKRHAGSHGRHGVSHQQLAIIFWYIVAAVTSLLVALRVLSYIRLYVASSPRLSTSVFVLYASGEIES